MLNTSVQPKVNKLMPILLTLVLNCVTLISEYPGILVYYTGQKSFTSIGRSIRKNKKQNKNATRIKINSGIKQFITRRTSAVLVNLFATFCFLVETSFYFYKSKVETKIKIKLVHKNYVSWILSATRYITCGRSQQDNRDSLGRGRINSKSQARQSWLALLYSGTSRRDNSTSSRDELLSQGAWCLCKKLKRDFQKAGLNLLSYFLLVTSGERSITAGEYFESKRVKRSFTKYILAKQLNTYQTLVKINSNQLI